MKALLVLLTGALTLSAPTVPTISGMWQAPHPDLWFSLQQQGTSLSVIPPEMSPEIFAALGSNALPGTLTPQGQNRFQAEVHFERKDLAVYGGKATCDVEYHLTFEGLAYKEQLTVERCAYREKISCGTQWSSDRSYSCEGVWLPIDPMDSCSTL